MTGIVSNAVRTSCLALFIHTITLIDLVTLVNICGLVTKIQESLLQFNFLISYENIILLL